MKKKWKGLILVGALVVALTGCGKAKAPTLEELKSGLSDSEITIVDASGKFDGSFEITVDDLDSTAEMFADELESELGVDVAKDGLNVTFDADFNIEGERNDDASHSLIELNANFNSNIDELNEEFEDTISDFKQEYYTDYKNKKEYEYDDDDDTWYVSEYEKSENSEKNLNEDVEKFLDLVISLNETRDKKEQIVVNVTDNDKYEIALDFVINKENVEGLSKDEKKTLQDILDDADMDIDLDNLIDMYEQLGDYDADVEIPISITMTFAKEGKENYVLDGATIKVSLDAKVSFTEENMEDITEDKVGMKISLTTDISVKANFECSISFGYEDVEVEIPKKVTDNAVEYSPTIIDWEWEEYDDEDYDYTIDDSDNDTSKIETYDENGNRLYTLYDYEDVEIFSFKEIEGFKYIDDYSTTTTIEFQSDFGDTLYVKCYMPYHLEDYYMGESTIEEVEEDYDVTYLGEVTTNLNPYGYDIWKSSWDNEYYAIFSFGEEYRNIAITLDSSFVNEPIFTDETIKQFILDNF